MPIHMGVMCEHCRRVYFIAPSRAIKPTALLSGMYRLTCNPCTVPREFRKESMLPYAVSDDVFRSGHAMEGEYKFVQATKPQSHSM
jgi:hypothetical protein